eukprot:scaffold10815_cov48-Phaeocystis_antarctica.AAC.1
MRCDPATPRPNQLRSFPARLSLPPTMPALSASLHMPHARAAICRSPTFLPDAAAAVSQPLPTVPRLAEEQLAANTTTSSPQI